MHGLSKIDEGKEIDWGKTSEDYASFRPDPPNSLYKKLQAMEVGLSGQKILDIGTGTGALARNFSKNGSVVSGTDISSTQIELAEKLTGKANLEINFHTAPAEEQPFDDNSFDVITASQCWLYFDKEKVIPEVKRLLTKNGVLVTTHFCWLPRIDEMARKSEELILKHNPQWSAADYSGEIPPFPQWAEGHFNLKSMFYYDEQISFTSESWRGRIRACRGVGAALDKEQVQKFDKEHEALINEISSDSFNVLHRVDAHIFSPK